MNITKSEEVVVLYKVGTLFGWRFGGEFLPKHAEVFAMITMVDEEATAINFASPDSRSRADLVLHGIITQKFAELLESGTFSLRTSSHKNGKDDLEAGQFICSLSGTPLVDFLTVVEKIDTYVRRLVQGDETSYAQFIVASAIIGTDVQMLKEYMDDVSRLIANLHPEWRYYLLSTNGERWNVLADALMLAFPENK
jgi:hypothetical protein